MMKQLGFILFFLMAGQAAAQTSSSQTHSIDGTSAVIRPTEAAEVDTFKIGAKLFSDRVVPLKECPDWLSGKNFLRSSIQSTDVQVVRDGVLTFLTPDPTTHSATQAAALSELGFMRIENPASFQLFGNKEIDRVWIYQKEVHAGDRFQIGKYVIALGFQTVSSEIVANWAENTGERLYNGIVLPQEWPPRDIDLTATNPIPVPYLEVPPEIIPIDVGRQLFVDDFLIEQSDLSRSFHKPQKYEGNPVLKPETPIERGQVEPEGYPKGHGKGHAGAAPKSGGCWWVPEEQVFKLWYETSWCGPIAMAESRDGLHWERPDLDVLPGSNIVLPKGITPDSWTVVRNWNAADPQEAWTMYLREPGPTGQSLCLTSPDGVHWNNRTSTPKGTGDRSTHHYNPFRKKWVFSIRAGAKARARRYYECDDFIKGAMWKGSDVVDWMRVDRNDRVDYLIGDTPQLYNLDAVAYESIMLGWFEIHQGPHNTDCAAVGRPKITELMYAFSRDGFYYDRPDRQAHIPASRGDFWDRGYVQSLGNICTIVGDKLFFYYIGFQGNGKPHGLYDNSATGVAFLRRDGFASMDAKDQSGTLTTRPVTFSGKHLFVNVNAPHGGLRAAVLDRDGNAIEPFTLANCVLLSTDSTLEPVTWKGGSDLSGLAGRPVRFQFELSDGELYSFWVSKDDSGRSDGYLAGGGPGYTGPTDTEGKAALKFTQQ